MMMRMIQNIKYKAMLGNKFIKTILIIIGILSSIVTYSQPYKYNNNTSIVANSNNEGIYIKYEETPAPDDTITLPDLVAFYPFNGNVIDSSGNDHNGVETGISYTTDKDGNANSAILFDGSSSYVTVTGDSANFNWGDAYTIAFWANISSTQTASFPILLSYGGYNQNGWYNYVRTTSNTERIYASMANNSGGTTYDSYNSNARDEWHYYTVVYRNDSMVTYTDGDYYSRFYAPIYNPTGGHALMIGTAYDSTNGVIGALDDLRLYKIDLSNSEVENLYNSTLVPIE
jgi:hypothetical protein